MAGSANRVKHRVLGHRHDVVEPWLGIQGVKDLRGGKAAVEPHKEPRLGKGQPQQRQQAPQHPQGALCGRHVARAQHGCGQIRLGFVVEGQKRQQGQITPTVVVPVEERQLLSAMGRIVGGVEIDRDPPGLPAAPPPMPLDHAHRQLARQPIEGGPPHVVLEPRDGRLGGECVARHRVPPEQQLVDGVVGEAVGIVAIGMAARDAEDALAEQVCQRVPDLAGLPIVAQFRGESRDEPILPFGRLEQDRPAIRARVLLIERGDEGLVEEVREEHSLWYRVGHYASASVVAKGLSAQPLYHTEAFVFGLRLAAS
ncbi:MAG: hypothetical protein O3A25_11545 [Acidobacteria bacterium]|nr:hypothetical protein [Acidobacteriota bacterium]